MHKAEGEISREKAPAHDNNVGTALPISSWQDKGSLPWVPCIWEEVLERKTRGIATLCLLPCSALRWQNFACRWGFTDLAEARVPAIPIPLANSCCGLSILVLIITKAFG